MTPLGTNLNQKVIQPFLMGGINTRNLLKPILVIIITDGEPTGEPRTTVAQVIKNAKNMCMNCPYGPGAIAFEFAQVSANSWIVLPCLKLQAATCCVSMFCTSLPLNNSSNPSAVLSLQLALLLLMRGPVSNDLVMQVGKDQAAQAFLGQLDKDPGTDRDTERHLYIA